MKIEYSQQALEDLQRLPKRFADQILRKIERLEGGLHGDVKRLTNYDCDYRLRSGDYRVLFDVEDDVISILRILNRKEAYE
jgi:mRNA interferase RelE/StbE